MMKETGFQLMMYLRLLGIQLRSQMQFRFSFWVELVSTGILNASYFLSTALIIQRFGSIAGWTLGEVAFLFGMIEMSFGAMDMIFSGFDPDAFSVQVREGRFDQLMLRPVGLAWQVLGSRFLLRRMGRIFEGLVIWLIGLSLLNVHWTLLKLLYLPVVFTSQLLAMGALFMMGSTLTFWTLQSVEAVNILTYGGVDLMSYPMQIYPGWMQRFFTYVMPFIFLNFYPALFLLDKPDPLHFPPFAPFMAPFVGVGLFLVALAFWRAGINHYQGSGT
ncbi:MAG: ABC-2 family transporter protein [Anaerolineaceae bacterium]|nr:ABC-2 family transporter protein [Anaerolineaceae bacterium]